MTPAKIWKWLEMFRGGSLLSLKVVFSQRRLRPSFLSKHIISIILHTKKQKKSPKSLLNVFASELISRKKWHWVSPYDDVLSGQSSKKNGFHFFKIIF